MTDSVLDFLHRCAPFDQLSGELLEYCRQHLVLSYLCKDNVEQIMPRDKPQLYLVKQGVFDLLDSNNQLIERLERGDLFGYPSLLTKRPITNRLNVIEDGLVYTLSQPAFDRLCQQDKSFAGYFSHALGDRLLTESRSRVGHDWTQMPVTDILERPLISVAPDCSMAEAAETMTAEKISCVLVSEQKELLGIVTDRDIRSRVVAGRQSFELPIRQFMTSPVISVDWQAPLFDVMQRMTSHNVHHVAVLREGNPVGVITASDLMRQQRSEPLFLVNQIRKASQVEQLYAIAESVPGHLHQFANRVVDVHLVGELLASFTDAFNVQLITLYLKENGPAPGPFVWLAFGSQARRDQAMGSDQDNGLLLSDQTEDQDLDWFAGLAEFVCQGMARCGLRLCTGNIMATNPQLRLSLNGWLKNFARWIDEPHKDALLRTNIFFDHRRVFGDRRLYEGFANQVSRMAGNQIFLANLAANAADQPVPIGLFNRFRTQRIGVNEQVLDIKKNGIAILNDIVRVHALAAQLPFASTPQRLRTLGENKGMSVRDSEDLLAAWRFLVQLRLQHQLDGQVSDNLINPDSLDSLTRRQLKAAFRLLKDAQEGLAMKFSRGAF
ncbi:putative nucleotidyltransferase substrate binding domain-containing protein [Bowmanella dokdonensis]|uniref:CBS domain-containing protein n=1 Tax=Bowmanella dokdonensis TaxID=751969 RepID=A0A939ISX2_9ALTE|nr:putative nucleotidyltransferase substrate binding domain-containing protein [Bowmanella dokdonensis]MBN7826876.1 CBS domain-containing protein [Bowmanella dokdonensis]